MLQRTLTRCAQDGSDLVVVLLDLDHFKAFNDTHGHPAGDRLLVGAAHAWGGVLAGTGGQLARWGGEEFLVVLAGVDRTTVEALLARMRDVVPEDRTFSAGAARRDPAGGGDVAALVATADEALYAAKAAGRDRTCWAPDAPGAQVATAARGAVPVAPAVPVRPVRRSAEPAQQG